MYKRGLQLVGDYCISLNVLLGPLNSILANLRCRSEKILVVWIGLRFL